MMLDAEVSELDRRLVAAHLARCAGCRVFEESVRAFTDEVRAATLEAPRQPIALRRLPPPLRRISLTAAQYSAAASVLIAVVGVMTQFGVQEQQRAAVSAPRASANLFSTAWQPEVELAQLDGATGPRGVDRPGPLPAF